jgi:tol-pal system protein YbgF
MTAAPVRHLPGALAALVAGVSLLGIAAPAIAQDTAPPPPVAAKPAKPVKPAAPSAQKAPKAEGTATPGAPSGEQALRQRIDNLEEQLVDMQVVVGTLESLAKSGGAASGSATYRGGGAEAPAAGAGIDSARVSGLEAQIKALTTQVQQLSEQVRSMGGTARRAETVAAPPSVAAAPPVPTGFGPVTVSPVRAEAGDGSAGTAGLGGDVSAAPLPPVAAAAPAGDGASPKQMYETAYGYLLQQDYGAAEAAFDEFLKRYPSDTLAGNAQFWLGESHFVRGQYKPAASAFLKGYQNYAKSSKAPDSLLKLAMSLGRLGQKDAACSSFAELNTRFPAASADVKSRATTERQRTGCP